MAEGRSDGAAARRAARTRCGSDRGAGDFLRLVEHADDPLADSSALAVWTLSREAARRRQGRPRAATAATSCSADISPIRRRSCTRGDVADADVGASAARGAAGRASADQRAKGVEHLQASPVSPCAPTCRRPSPTSAGTAHGCRTRRAARLDAAACGSTRPARWRGWRARHALPAGRRCASCRARTSRSTCRTTSSAKSDRMSMAHGLEVRSPFLDPDLAEFALRLPAALKVSAGGATKRVLRELARRDVRARMSPARRSRVQHPRARLAARAGAAARGGPAVAAVARADSGTRRAGRRRRRRRSHDGPAIVRVRGVGPDGARRVASPVHPDSRRPLPATLSPPATSTSSRRVQVRTMSDAAITTARTVS